MMSCITSSIEGSCIASAFRFKVLLMAYRYNRYGGSELVLSLTIITYYRHSMTCKQASLCVSKGYLQY